MGKSKWLKRERLLERKTIKTLYRFYSEGWRIIIHTEENPIYVSRGWSKVPLKDIKFSAISPEGLKYHGDHISLFHGKYKISIRGYQDFWEEPVKEGAFEEIETAFKIFGLCNRIDRSKLEKIINQLNSKFFE